MNPCQNHALEQQREMLQKQAEALHKIAHIIGFAAGEDVTTAPIAVRVLKSGFDRLEQIYQDAIAERDDWRTYAKEAGAQKVKMELALKEMTRQRDELLAAQEVLSAVDGQVLSMGEYIAAFQKDAARYRWLIQQELWEPTREELPKWYGGKIKWQGGDYSMDEIDAIIDAAMTGGAA